MNYPLVLLILSILFSFSAFSQESTKGDGKEGYFRIDTIKTIVYKDSSFCEYFKFSGEYKLLRCFDSQQRITESRRYYNGTLNSVCEWNVNGNLKELRNFDSNGKLKFQKHYSDQGVLMASEFFSSGKKDGKWQYWYPDGQLKEVRHYTNDIEDSTHVIYYENGLVKEIGSYGEYNDADTLLPIRYGQEKVEHDFLEIIATFTYRKSKNGIWKEYDEEGNLRKEITYDNGEVIKVVEY